MSYNPYDYQNTNQKMPSMDNILNEINNPVASIPSRDIPTQQFPSSQLDPHNNIEYIGKTNLDDNDEPSNDYQDGRERQRQRYRQKQNESNKMMEEEEEEDNERDIEMTNDDDDSNNIFKTFKMPILIILLFFIFQMSIVKKLQFQYIPFIFSEEGNWNLFGIIINGMLFTFAYLFLQKLT